MAARTIWSLTRNGAAAKLDFAGQTAAFGLLGRDESLTIPWQEIETIGTDAILVHTAVPKAPAAPHGFWQQLRAKLGL